SWITTKPSRVPLSDPVLAAFDPAVNVITTELTFSVPAGTAAAASAICVPTTLPTVASTATPVRATIRRFVVTGAPSYTWSGSIVRVVPAVDATVSDPRAPRRVTQRLPSRPLPLPPPDGGMGAGRPQPGGGAS